MARAVSVNGPERSLIVTRTGEAEAVGKDSTLEMFSYDINVKKKWGAGCRAHEESDFL